MGVTKRAGGWAGERSDECAAARRLGLLDRYLEEQVSVPDTLTSAKKARSSCCSALRPRNDSSASSSSWFASDLGSSRILPHSIANQQARWLPGVRLDSASAAGKEAPRGDVPVDEGQDLFLPHEQERVGRINHLTAQRHVRLEPIASVCAPTRTQHVNREQAKNNAGAGQHTGGSDYLSSQQS